MHLHLDEIPRDLIDDIILLAGIDKINDRKRVQVWRTPGDTSGSINL
ncbi:hypothetical protein [Azomonas macrocytogenes]